MKNDNEKIQEEINQKKFKKFLIFICHFYFFIFSF
jgi:hypothetical protein